jgi:hypothetical protein
MLHRLVPVFSVALLLLDHAMLFLLHHITGGVV